MWKYGFDAVSVESICQSDRLSALFWCVVFADMCGKMALILWASNFHVFAFVVLCFGLFWCIAIRILYFVCLGGHLWRVGFVSVCVFFFMSWWSFFFP